MSVIHPMRRVVAVLVLGIAVAAAARPCAARGTGGFLREWLMCAPLEGIDPASPPLAADFLPYPGCFALGRVWLPVEAGDTGVVDIGRQLMSAAPGVAILHTYFEVPADGTYTLRIGSDDAVRVEIDGQVVHTHLVHRSLAVDEDIVPVPLVRGWHRMLVRVANYDGAWGLAVRMADDKNQPLDLPHQVAAPPVMEAALKLDEAAPPAERNDVATYLSQRTADLVRELEAIQARLAAAPEGYVTFSEYEGARDLGLRFFRSLTTLVRETAKDARSEETAWAARASAVGAAAGFSDVLAEKVREAAASIGEGRHLWERLGRSDLTRRALATAALRVAGALEETRRLALRVERDRLRMARLENDIRNWRQREFTLHVVDPEGVAVEDAVVEVVQVRHEFLFGCNAFSLGQWDDARQNRLYEERFLDLFNLAVVPIYWSTVEEQRGRPDYAAVDALVQWAEINRVRVKATPLVWGETVPRWVDGLAADDATAAVRDHVRRTMERYRDRVDFWDVVNQPAAEMRIGAAAIDLADVLRWAADARPKGRLMINLADPLTAQPLVAQIESRGARVDDVGLQAHQHEGPWPLEVFQQRIEQAATSGKPIQISEVTLLGAEEDEREQADAVRWLYTAAFAHPAVTSVIWWDLSDRFAWQQRPAGLCRADLSPKPAYRALDHLINHLWRTDVAGRTGPDGRMTVRAFFGRHRVTVRAEGRQTTLEVHLGKEGPAEIEVVLPAPPSATTTADEPATGL